MQLRWLEIVTDREVIKTLQYTDVNGNWCDVEEVFINNQSKGNEEENA